MPTLGPELRAARQARRMSQAALSVATGVSEDTIQRMERDEGYDCHIDALLAIVSYIGVPLGSVIRHPRRSEPWNPGR